MRGEPFKRGSFGWWVSMFLAVAFLSMASLLVIALFVRLFQVVWP